MVHLQLTPLRRNIYLPKLSFFGVPCLFFGSEIPFVSPDFPEDWTSFSCWPSRGDGSATTGRDGGGELLRFFLGCKQETLENKKNMEKKLSQGNSRWWFKRRSQTQNHILMLLKNNLFGYKSSNEWRCFFRTWMMLPVPGAFVVKGNGQRLPWKWIWAVARWPWLFAVYREWKVSQVII